MGVSVLPYGFHAIDPGRTFWYERVDTILGTEAGLSYADLPANWDDLYDKDYKPIEACTIVLSESGFEYDPSAQVWVYN